MPDERTSVDRLYAEATEVIRVLDAGAEISLRVSAADQFRKALLLAAASYFEHRICNLLVEFVRECAGGSTLVENFVRIKAITRQYHTLFAWDARNANHFFGPFGDEFRAIMIKRIGDSQEMQASVRAFLEVGSERNKLVHQDYATFPLEKTLEEIYELYRSALNFVESLPLAFRDGDTHLKANRSP
jgi:hypothetical protein